MVDYSSLENYRTERYRGFESLSLRKEFNEKSLGEQLLDRFISSRPSGPTISEDEIMDEVRSVRYVK